MRCLIIMSLTLCFQFHLTLQTGAMKFVSSRSEWPSPTIDIDKTTVTLREEDDDLCDVPFQRFELSRPPSTFREDSVVDANCSTSSFAEFPKASPDPFASIEANGDSTEGTSTLNVKDNEAPSHADEDDENNNDHQPRPHSANSIASVWKSVTTTTQIFSDSFTLCGGQQGHTEEENHIPFYHSDVRVSPSTIAHSSFCDEHSNATIQVRHVKSTPVGNMYNNSKSSLSSTFTFDEGQMRRSCSTPAKFQPGWSGSAFGRVPNTSLITNSSKGVRSKTKISNRKNTSAFSVVEASPSYNASKSKKNLVLHNEGSKDTGSVLSNGEVSDSLKKKFFSPSLSDRKDETLRTDAKEWEREVTKIQTEISRFSQ